MIVILRDKKDNVVAKEIGALNNIEYDREYGEIALSWVDFNAVERIRVVLSKRDLRGLVAWALENLP